MNPSDTESRSPSTATVHSRARVDHEEVVGLVAFAEEHVAAGDGEHLADLAQGPAALVVQARECTVAVDGLRDSVSEGFTHR